MAGLLAVLYRHRQLRRLSRLIALRCRLRRQSGCPEVDRLRDGRAAPRKSADRHDAARAVRCTAQRHGAAGLQALVDATRSSFGRAQHLCALRQRRAVDPGTWQWRPLLDPVFWFGGHAAGEQYELKRRAGEQEQYTYCWLIETVLDGVTGCFWSGGADDLAHAVAGFDDRAIRPSDCVENAARFDSSVFRAQFPTRVRRAIELAQGAPGGPDLSREQPFERPAAGVRA